MLKQYVNPPREQWPAICTRPAIDYSQLREKVSGILDDVRLHGDEALKKYTARFDGAHLDELAVNENEFRLADGLVPGELKEAIGVAAANIQRFHQAQAAVEAMIETMPGVRCWRRPVAIDRVGLYIPGGTAPLFSTILMLAIPAKIAGCGEIILCTPPSKDGSVHPAILYVARLTGVTKIFKAGGAQAIGAMAYGTESIPAVSKIFGPGNQYVNCAKQLVQMEGVAIDMPAGPSEVCVLADKTGDARFVAADLLAQAEHGPDSQVLLVCDSLPAVERISLELSRQLQLIPRKDIAAKALQNSHAVVFDGLAAAMDFINQYAPEHLIIARRDANTVAELVRNAGSVFIGNYTPESAGDYASGTNHTLPTNGFAKSYSGVSLDSFVKKISFQEITREGLNTIGPAVATMARAEGLEAHEASITVRMEK